jgi:hypothetical protein
MMPPSARFARCMPRTTTDNTWKRVVVNAEYDPVINANPDDYYIAGFTCGVKTGGTL